MGGSFKAWRDDKKLSGSMIPLIRDFHAECENCRELIAQSRPDSLSAFPERPRPSATALAYAIMELEDACLVIAEEKLAACGLEVRALMFDGCLVSGGSTSAVESALRQAEEAAFATYGVVISWAIKDWRCEDSESPVDLLRLVGLEVSRDNNGPPGPPGNALPDVSSASVPFDVWATLRRCRVPSAPRPAPSFTGVDVCLPHAVLQLADCVGADAVARDIHSAFNGLSGPFSCRDIATKVGVQLSNLGPQSLRAHLSEGRCAVVCHNGHAVGLRGAAAGLVELYDGEEGGAVLLDSSAVSHALGMVGHSLVVIAVSFEAVLSSDLYQYRASGK